MKKVYIPLIPQLSSQYFGIQISSPNEAVYTPIFFVGEDTQTNQSTRNLRIVRMHFGDASLIYVGEYDPTEMTFYPDMKSAYLLVLWNDLIQEESPMHSTAESFFKELSLKSKNSQRHIH